MVDNVFDYPEVKSVVICGDIHGEFREMVFRLCARYGMNDTLLIVAGDCGFGFEKPAYYEQVFSRISSKLSKANNYIAMVRGNHDDPSYFNEQRVCHKRFRTIPDYGVIKACGHNILCVGGAVSVDRFVRIAKDSHFRSAQTATYWMNEMPYIDQERMSIITQNILIDTVVTHTAPSFCELIDKAGLSGWAQIDPSLLEDCSKERNVMDQIYDFLTTNNQSVNHWYYGHFHQSWNSSINGILFSMLDILEFKELR